MRRQTQILVDHPFAHRGLHDVSVGVPENSLAAFDAAINEGYGIELDIQMSRDGVPMVFHDYELGRLTPATGAIRQRDAKDLISMAILGTDQCIPTLAQVLEFVSGQTPLLIEVKDQDGAMGANTHGIEAAISDDLRSYSGAAAVMSFNPNSVAHFAKYLPDIERGLVTCAFSADDFPTLPAKVRDRLRKIPDFAAVHASFISHDQEDLDRPQVAEMRANGVPVVCWTIASAEEEAAARPYCDNVTFEGYRPKI